MKQNKLMRLQSLLVVMLTMFSMSAQWLAVTRITIPK